MVRFKESLGHIGGLASSDRKKLLSMPIYMSKRVQNPEPLRGQKEFDLFTSLCGTEFTSDYGVRRDNEKKITEFEYEKFLNPALLQRVN
jgi:hypothetical protein